MSATDVTPKVTSCVVIWPVSPDVTTCGAAGDDWQCDRTSMARGPHCRAHYVQLRNYGELKPLRTWPNRQPKPCPACDDGTLAAWRGYCTRHSYRARKLSQPTQCAECSASVAVITRSGLCESCWSRSRRPLCDIDGCERRTDYGVCRVHWEAEQAAAERRCAVEWCERTDLQTSRTGPLPVCSRHRYHLEKYGRVDHERFVPCQRCGDPIDRKVRPIDSINCLQCKRRVGAKYGMSARQLAARDGAVCALGGEPIDMRMKWPAPGSPTVDHIVPRSIGGTDEPENLQLACLRHNQAKGNRVEVCA